LLDCYVFSASLVGAAQNIGVTALAISFEERLTKGARNLLLNCAKCQPGDTLLIVRETDDIGYYDPELCTAIKNVADDIGLITKMFGVPLSRDVTAPSADLEGEMGKADCTVFLARLGDQIRFRPKNSPNLQIISYALDRDMLASPFGTIDYQAFEALKEMVNMAVFQGSEIRVTCPAGTDFGGAIATMPMSVLDTTLKRFPVSVFAPIPGEGFSGRIAQNGFLTGTGSQYYTPWSCELKETVFVNFENTRITGFEGSVDDVAAAKAHYEFVGNKYGIDTYYLHSWHAGIHPGCEFKKPAGDDFERWSGGAFGNPRILHFHTCGAYPPGEISLNILDATVCVDGVALWENGELYVSRIAGGEALLEEYPDMRAIFEKPATRVGQAENGKLMYA
jgi:hypothetical protein